MARIRLERRIDLLFKSSAPKFSLKAEVLVDEGQFNKLLLEALRPPRWRGIWASKPNPQKREIRRKRQSTYGQKPNGIDGELVNVRVTHYCGIVRYSLNAKVCFEMLRDEDFEPFASRG